MANFDTLKEQIAQLIPDNTEQAITAQDVRDCFDDTIDAINAAKEDEGAIAPAQWGGITGDLADQTDLKNALDAKQDVIADLGTIRSGAAAGATAYQLPSGGIPASDIESGVIPANVVSFSAQTLTDAQKKQARDNIYAAENPDREYNTQDPNGLGYLVLEKDKTFAEQVTEANTIYEIRYDFVLDADFALPTGCMLKFEGGTVTGAALTGAVVNESLRPEWFGAIGDGSTDDATAFSRCIALALPSSAKVELDGTKTYAIKTSASFSSANNVFIEGNGATLLVSNNAEVAFKNARYATTQCPQNITRGAASITFSSLPSGLQEDDIIHIISTEIGETSYSSKRQQTTRVAKISGTTIYLSDTVTMDYTAADTSLFFFKPRTVNISELRLVCASGSLRHHLYVEYYIPIFEQINIDGYSASYGVVFQGCVDGYISNNFIAHIQYGYLVNVSAHITFDGVHCVVPSNHPVAIANFSNYITVRRVTGLGALIESHTGFNITFEDCVFGCSSSNPWTLRAVGAAMRRCRVFSYDGTKVQPVLVASVALYDLSIYNDYNCTFEDCDLEMDTFGAYRSNIVSLERCKFLPNTTIGFGVSGTTSVNIGRIFRCLNITAVKFGTNTIKFESDQDTFDAVIENGSYIIKLGLASVNLRARNGEWSGHGNINIVDTVGSLTIPVILYPQHSSISDTGARNMYINFDFTIFAANRSGGIDYAEKKYRAVIIHSPSYNQGKLLRVEDLMPDEQRITATVTDFAYSGGTSNPAEQMESFTLNISNSIGSSSQARLSVMYECSIVGRDW